MRTIANLTLLCLTLGTLACREGEDQVPVNALNDELRRDLELAQSQGLELASPARDHRQAHVVSAIELARPGVPVRSAVRQKAVLPRPAPAPAPAASPVSEPAPEPVVVAAATREPEVISHPAPEPLPVPEPAPVPVRHPSDDEASTADTNDGDVDAGDVGADGEGSEEDDGSVIGDLIGVVIRGGAVGDDHCEIHDRGRGGGRTDGIPYPGTIGMPGGVLINDRVPVSQP